MFIRGISFFPPRIPNLCEIRGEVIEDGGEEAGISEESGESGAEEELDEADVIIGLSISFVGSSLSVAKILNKEILLKFLYTTKSHT